jgi:hypothetical protein
VGSQYLPGHAESKAAAPRSNQSRFLRWVIRTPTLPDYYRANVNGQPTHIAAAEAWLGVRQSALPDTVSRFKSNLTNFLKP